MPVASLIAGGVQAAVGAGQTIAGNAKLKRLFSQRKAFQTPQEIFDILNMTENNAQTGLSSETTQYLTDQADRGLTSQLGVATRLGADPNQIGATLDNYFQDIFKIGNENEIQKLKKFDSVANALQLVAQNKEAEFQSKDNLIKDQMQSAAQKVASGQQNLQSGLNLGLNAASAFSTQDLYKTQFSKLQQLLGGGTITTGENSGSGAGGSTPSDILALLNGIK
jgi:hypothetical protein